MNNKISQKYHLLVKKVVRNGVIKILEIAMLVNKVGSNMILVRLIKSKNSFTFLHKKILIHFFKNNCHNFI